MLQADVTLSSMLQVFSSGDSQRSWVTHIEDGEVGQASEGMNQQREDHLQLPYSSLCVLRASSAAWTYDVHQRRLLHLAPLPS